MGAEPPAWVSAVLSTPRFTPYLAATAGDTEAAIELEWWNLEVAAAFVVPLNRLELALRNALHRTLATTFSRSDWWQSAPLDNNGKRKVAEAKRQLAQLQQRPEAADDGPIHHRHLEADHATVYRLLTLLSPPVVTELAPRDRVPGLLVRRTTVDVGGRA